MAPSSFLALSQNRLRADASSLLKQGLKAAQNETRGQIRGNRILTLFGNAALMVMGLCPFTTVGSWWQLRRSEEPMVGLATAMFIGLFAFGHELFGWSGMPNDEVQLGLFLAFILGIVCGYKTKG